MSADQLRRAAEDADSRGWSEDDAVAALLRANEQRHRPYSLDPSFCGYCGEDVPWPCPDAEDATRVAAAYLGEEPQSGGTFTKADAKDPLRQGDTVPVDRDLLIRVLTERRIWRQYEDGEMSWGYTNPEDMADAILAEARRLPNPDQEPQP